MNNKVKNKFRIDHNDTIPLTKLSWPSKLTRLEKESFRALLLLRGFTKVKKKKIFNHQYDIFTKILHKMDIWSILIDKTQFRWDILTILFFIENYFCLMAFKNGFWIILKMGFFIFICICTMRNIEGNLS